MTLLKVFTWQILRCFYVFFFYTWNSKTQIAYLCLAEAILISIHNIWATPWENVSSGVSGQASHKPACAATEAS